MRWASTIVRDPGLARAAASASEQLLDTLGARPDLAIAFVSARYGDAVRDLSERLPRALRECTFIGCAGAGVIGGGRECEDEAALSLTVASLPGAALAARHLEDGSLPSSHAPPATWHAHLGGFAPEARPHFLVLADPFSFTAESLLRALDRHYPASTKVGGLASGGRRRGENALFVNGAVHASGAACLAFAGDVEVDAIVAQGCRPIGQPLFVTRAHGNLLLELDGRRPTELLRALYEGASARDRELLAHSLFLGLVMRPGESRYEQGDFLVRNLLGADEESGALWIGAELQANQVVQFHVRDAVTSAEDLEQALGGLRQDAGPPAGALLFSCLGRGRHLYGRPDHDTEAFRRRSGGAPLGGFFCNGEIGPVRGRSFVHGYTSAFALFRPRAAA
jgi:small ligand-binding sensory domain FIST